MNKQQNQTSHGIFAVFYKKVRLIFDMLTTRRKKQLRKVSVLMLLSALIILTGIMLYQWILNRKTLFVRYPEFGISIPQRYMIHGIDVSKYQQDIEWEEVKGMKVKEIQLGFCFIKATEGLKNQDPRFKKNWQRAKKAGLHRGAYHFFIASKDGLTQASNFINTVKLEPGDLPPVLDVEQIYGTTATRLKTAVKKWLTAIEQYYGVKPIIYTNVDFYERYLGSDFDKYPLWVAHYYQPQEPRIKRDWIFWQHSDEGRVNGIRSKVDFNVFKGDSTDFSKLLIQ